MITYEFLDHRTIAQRTADDINLLLPQLSAASEPLTVCAVESIVRDARLLVARTEEGAIKGMATLCIIRGPSGTKGFVEDVVVDASLCGQGIGAGLVTELIAEAKRRGAQKIELTSRPERVAANRLYQKLGFELRKTNHYRMAL